MLAHVSTSSVATTILPYLCHSHFQVRYAQPNQGLLKLKPHTQITKLILPSALPLIFTGMRLSLGVGWMVLIAAEMLAQNPGLGKFVWDEFQNGSSQSLAKIIVAVLTIGVIGFLLDRVMYALQTMFTHTSAR